MAAAIFTALDPAKRIGKANDAQRWEDITAIAEAYMRYAADFKGSFVTSTTDGKTYFIQHASGTAATDRPDTCPASTSVASTPTQPIDLHGLIAHGYIGDIPNDPLGTDDDSTEYYFYKDAAGTMTIGACEKYSGETNYPTIIR